jgi:hypothetical protein
MVQGVESSFDTNFVFLGDQKSDLGEVAYVMFSVGEWT